MIKCQCDHDAIAVAPPSWYLKEERKAMTHKPNKCPGDYGLKQYLRNGKKVTLCSACNLMSDVLVKE